MSWRWDAFRVGFVRGYHDARPRPCWGWGVVALALGLGIVLGLVLK